MNGRKGFVCVLGTLGAFVFFLTGIYTLRAGRFDWALVYGIHTLTVIVAMVVVVRRGIARGAATFGVVFLITMAIVDAVSMPSDPNTRQTSPDENVEHTPITITSGTPPIADGYEEDDDDNRIRVYAGDGSSSDGCDNDGDQSYDEDNDRDNDGICDEG